MLSVCKILKIPHQTISPKSLCTFKFTQYLKLRLMISVEQAKWKGILDYTIICAEVNAHP